VGFARDLLDTFQGPTLILRARIVFGLLAALLGFAIYRAKAWGPRAAQSSGTSAPMRQWTVFASLSPVTSQV
jgi:ethanolaminephosphotransferase